MDSPNLALGGGTEKKAKLKLLNLNLKMVLNLIINTIMKISGWKFSMMSGTTATNFKEILRFYTIRKEVFLFFWIDFILKFKFTAIE